LGCTGFDSEVAEKANNNRVLHILGCKIVKCLPFALGFDHETQREVQIVKTKYFLISY